LVSLSGIPIYDSQGDAYFLTTLTRTYLRCHKILTHSISSAFYKQLLPIYLWQKRQTQIVSNAEATRKMLMRD